MTIYWTKKAKNRFLEITNYITSEFGSISSAKFKERTFDFLILLSEFPELGSLEVPNKNIYGFQLSKQTKLFYRINNNHISLLTFFHSRQDPKQKPK